MTEKWVNEVSCATQCSRCHKQLYDSDNRILSAYDHLSICLECKQDEEQRDDYKEIFRAMIGQYMADTEGMWGDPGDFCYHHFYPYKCIKTEPNDSGST